MGVIELKYGLTMKLLLHAKEKAFSIASHMQSAHLIVIQTFLCKPKSSLHVSKQFFKYKRNLYTTNWLNFFEWTAMESIYFWSWEIVTFDWIFVCWWWSRTEFIYQKELWWTHVIGSFFTYCVFQLEYTWKFLLLLLLTFV